jgi:small conductance mechanosensitive channel
MATSFPSLFPAKAAAPAAPPAPPISDQVRDLIAGGPQAWWPLLSSAAHLAVSLTIGLIILLGTLWLAGWASELSRRAMNRFHGRHPPDVVLTGFVASLVRYTVIVVGGIAALQQVGVQTTSVLAVLGAASLAIGLALQGGLSNVAAGVMILLLRPYRVGDRVELAGVVGRVRGLDLFTTRLHDLDNLVVIIPNSKVLGEKIVNYSAPESRRIVMEFGIDYADDVDLALALLIETAKADPRIVEDPAPWAKLTELGDSTVTVMLRAWTSPDGYVDTRYDLIKAVKERFEAAGLSFPYPHQVAVESRPFAPPDPERQRRELDALKAAPPKAATPPPAGKDRADRSTGSSSEAR